MHDFVADLVEEGNNNEANQPLIQQPADNYVEVVEEGLLFFSNVSTKKILNFNSFCRNHWRRGNGSWRFYRWNWICNKNEFERGK